jgi:hypothetical protein
MVFDQTAQQMIVHDKRTIVVRHVEMHLSPEISVGMEMILIQSLRKERGCASSPYVGLRTPHVFEALSVFSPVTSPPSLDLKDTAFSFSLHQISSVFFCV